MTTIISTNSGNYEISSLIKNDSSKPSIIFQVKKSKGGTKPLEKGILPYIESLAKGIDSVFFSRTPETIGKFGTFRVSADFSEVPQEDKIELKRQIMNLAIQQIWASNQENILISRELSSRDQGMNAESFSSDLTSQFEVPVQNLDVLEDERGSTLDEQNLMSIDLKRQQVKEDEYHENIDSFDRVNLPNIDLKGQSIEKDEVLYVNPDEFTMEAIAKQISDKNFDISYRKCLMLEKKLREFKAKNDNWDSIDIAGGLGFSIDPQKIPSFLQNKFDDLRKRGILITRSEFEKLAKSKKYLSLGRSRTVVGHKSSTLDRLWGSEYLRACFVHHQKSDYRTPDMHIIVEDSVTQLPITIDGNNKYLEILSLDPTLGEIVAEHIDGEPNAGSINPQHGWLMQVGYVDLKESSNILKSKDDTFYVVDTEIGAFDSRDSNKNINLLKIYAKLRFQAFNPSARRIISLNITNKL